MNKRSNIKLLNSLITWIGISAITMTWINCATTYKYVYPGHKTFIVDNVAKLKIGMTATEIRQIFGNPDEEYGANFGSNVGEEWKGRVWLYFTELDTSLKHAKRYKKNMFVFYPSSGDMRLNHWKIEE